MATEYKLSYTASDINKRLGMVDNMVKSVNGVMPDESGNVAIDVGSSDSSQNGNCVKTVNGVEPDENGNVKIETGVPTNEQISTAVDAFFGKTPPAAVSVDTDEEGTIILTGGEYYENGNEVAY